MLACVFMGTYMYMYMYIYMYMYSTVQYIKIMDCPSNCLPVKIIGLHKYRITCTLYMCTCIHVFFPSCTCVNVCLCISHVISAFGCRPNTSGVSTRGRRSIDSLN